MDSKRRVSVMTDNEEEDHLGSVKFAEITPIEPATPESLMKKGQDLYLIQQFEESSQLFHKAWMIQQTSGAGAVQIANNIAACMLRQRDFSGVLKWTKLTLEVSKLTQAMILQACSRRRMNQKQKGHLHVKRAPQNCARFFGCNCEQ